MVKVKMSAYGADYNLHCPRCGNDEWSDKVYRSFVGRDYRKCLHCGSDARTDNTTNVVIVTERPFVEFTPQTYDLIEKELEGTQWMEDTECQKS